MKNILSKVFKLISMLNLCPIFKICMIGLLEAVYNILTYFSRHRAVYDFYSELQDNYTREFTRVGNFKLAIVTGGSNGLGKKLVEILIKMGYRVHVLARNVAAMEEMKNRYGPERFNFSFLDLGDCRSIKKCVMNLLKKYKDEVKNEKKFIDLLVNNAGIYHRELKFIENVEMNLLVNHIGHYILTKELSGYVSRRIVNVSSSALFSVQKFSYYKYSYAEKSLDVIYKSYKNKKDYLMTKYSMSKLANILFSLYLKKNLEQPITVVAVHPGIIASGLFDNVEYGKMVNILQRFCPFILFSIEEGAMCIAKAAFSDEITNSNTIIDFFMRGERGVIPNYVNIDNANELMNYTKDICKRLGIE